MLKSKNIAWVGEDTDDHPAQRRDTASFHFVRLRKLDYSDEELAEWSAYFKQVLANRKDCYVFCRHKDTVAPWVWGQKIRDVVG